MSPTFVLVVTSEATSAPSNLMTKWLAPWHKFFDRKGIIHGVLRR